MWPQDCLGLIEVVDSTGVVEAVRRTRALRLKGAVTAAAGSRENVLTFPPGVGPTGDKGAKGSQGIQGIAGATGAAAAIGLHDTTHSPVGLWQFNGTLADTSGNGYDLSVDTGTVTYAAMVPGLVGVRLSSLRLKAALAANLLRITGNVTVEVLCQLEADTVGSAVGTNAFISFTGGQDDSSSTLNYLYHLAFNQGRLPQWFSEHGTGVNDVHTITDQALPPLGQLFHFAAVRAFNIVQLYVNGRPFGPPSSVLTEPTDGSASQLWVGGSGGTSPVLCSDRVIASLKIIPAALSAAQVKAEFNRTAGKFYGSLS